MRIRTDLLLAFLNGLKVSVLRNICVFFLCNICAKYFTAEPLRGKFLADVTQKKSADVTQKLASINLIQHFSISQSHTMRLIYTFSLLSLTLSLQAQVFMRPFDNAAAMGLGGATVALPNLSAGIANEGQLGLGEKPGVFAGSAIPYAISGWQSAHFQGMVGVGTSGGIGLGVFHAATDLYAEQRFQLSYGRRLAEKLYLGGSVDVLHNNAQEYGANTAATFSLGVLAKALPQVWIAAKIQNPLQQKIGDDLVPTVLRLGTTWKPSELFFLALETEKDLERPAQVKMGVEYKPSPLLAIRAGTRTGKVARMAFGIGLRLKNGVSLDVGSEWHPTLGITPAAMISWKK